MAASDHLQPGQYRRPQPSSEQLRMFMPAGEVYENYPSVDSEYRSPSKQANAILMREKLSEADYSPQEGGKGETLYQNIMRRGVERPVRLYQGMKGKMDRPDWSSGWLGNGGHRVAVMAHAKPDSLIPVVHGDSFYDYERSPDYDEDYAGWNSKDIRQRHGAS